MTRKQRKFISAMRDGLSLAEAAAIAGYTRDYAQRLLNEPSMIAAIEERPAEKPAKAAGRDDSDPKKVLQEIISDPTGDEKVKIAAIRALTAIKREEQEPEFPAVTIIDDIQTDQGCAGCPLLEWVVDLWEEFGPGKEGSENAETGNVAGSPGAGVHGECG